MDQTKDLTIIFGAGPAGLTAAFELTTNSKKVIVLEADQIVGGIARTAQYKGYRFDIGGHRFFTKSKIVKDLWFRILPLSDWLIDVPRLSRIYFNRKFFAYPLKAFDALFKLGIFKSIIFISSYLYYKIFPIQKVRTFEDWVINNFGKKLYLVFFKTYTEKVWGIACSEISSDWAAQRIKGLSLKKAILNATSGFNFFKKKKILIKTLIDKFDYPKYGPGMLWEKAAEIVIENGGEIKMNYKVSKIYLENNIVTKCEVENDRNLVLQGNNFISTLPIKELVNSIIPEPPKEIINAANELRYRDFLTVVLIFDQENVFPDNWIYVHEPNVKLGRIQNFKNWSLDMVPNKNHTSLGLEYFCNENDELWSLTDEKLIELGLKEVEKIGIIKSHLFLDGTVVKMPKAYPVYDDSYRKNVELIRNWVNDHAKNLQLVGRNGMHMYNNQDHSMYAAYLAARNILGEKWDPWKVNADAEYHEEEIVEGIGRLVPRKI